MSITYAPFLQSNERLRIPVRNRYLNIFVISVDTSENYFEKPCRSRVD